MFEPEVYIARREHLITRLEEQGAKGLVLLLGNGESPRNFAHNCYRFRQDSTFLYYLGIPQPNLAAIIDIDSRSTELFGTDPTVEEIVWTGPKTPVDQLARASGAESVSPGAGLPGLVRQAQKKGRSVHSLPPYSADQRERLAGFQSPAPSDALVRAVSDQRMYKSTEEITEIETAADITVEMHRAAARTLTPGASETEVAAAVRRVAIAGGGDLAFATIATVRGEILHYGFSERRMKGGQLLLLDIGAEATSGYAADLTRTYPVSGRFTERQHRVYRIVEDAFDTAVGLCAPGVKFLDVHIAACHRIVEGLKDLGVMRGNTEDAVATGAHALFFPCGVGHMLGLDVHDMENLGEEIVGYDTQQKSAQFGLSSLRLGRSLEPRFVVTVEPGVYFNEILADQWQSRGLHREFVLYDRLGPYWDFGGCRIENDYLITDTGSRRLGQELPKAADDIETLLREQGIG